MELKRKVTSKLPTSALWLIVIVATGFELAGFSELVVEDLPRKSATLIFGLTGLSLLAYLLEKVLPKKEVLFCRISESYLRIAPGGRKLFHWTLKEDDIDMIRVAKGRFYGKEMYIFLKNGSVKSFYDDSKEMDRLVEFISANGNNITI